MLCLRDKGAPNPNPGVVSDGVLPNALVNRSLEAAVHQELFSVLDRQNGGILHAHRGSLFRRDLFVDRLDGAVRRVPELHSLVDAADDGNFGQSVFTFDEHAPAAHPRGEKLDGVAGVVHDGPVVSDNAEVVDRASEECGYIFTDL